MSRHWLEIIEETLGDTLTPKTAAKLELKPFGSLVSQLARHHNGSTLPERSVSQLRPRLDGSGTWRAVVGTPTEAPKPLRSMLKSMLLLADSVALQDPLVEAWLDGRGHDKSVRLAILRKRLQEVAMVADLIRTDVVIVYSPPPSLISMNSGFTITDHILVDDIQEVTESELSPEQLERFRADGLESDWDAAWLAHSLERGTSAPFAENLAIVKSEIDLSADNPRIFFRGSEKLLEQVKGLLWEHRVRYYYDGRCDPGPLSPDMAKLFCRILTLLRQIVTSRDEVETQNYYFLLKNPLIRADAIALQDIVTLRKQAGEFVEWRQTIREALEYAYHAKHEYVSEHHEFMNAMQIKINNIKLDIGSGHRGRVLSQTLEVGDAFTVGGVAGLAQYLLQADLAQSLIAAPAGALGAILYRVIKTLCLENHKSVQSHFVAFGQ